MRGWPRAIDLRHPLAVLATRLPWSQLEADLAPIWRRESRDGVLPEGEDLFGSGGGVLVAAGLSYAGRSRLPIRLMCSLLYLKHAFNLSDEETCERWVTGLAIPQARCALWQACSTAPRVIGWPATSPGNNQTIGRPTFQ